MMVTPDVTRALTQGEGQRLEFLAGTGSSLLDRVGMITTSFLNSEGGMILIGVDDSGQVVGIEDRDKAFRELQSQLSSAISPPAYFSITQQQASGATLLVVDVPSGSEVPYVYRGRIPIRQGPRTLAADGSAISRLIERRNTSTRWERQTTWGANIKDLDPREILQTIKMSIERFGTNAPKGPRDFLECLGLIHQDVPCNGAVVLFGREPSKFIPQSRVRVVRYAKSTGDALADSRVLEGPSFQLLDDINAFLRQHLPIASQFPLSELQRQDIPTYPWRALREAVLNALVHRDYSASDGGVSISLRPNRLEIWNSGEPLPPLTIQDLERAGVSRPHNPDIAHVFYLRGLVERVGIGVRTIKQECAKAGLPEPEWAQVAGGIRLTLYARARRSPKATPSKD
jgi:ATP-dependent DNA helicase RecG